MRCGLSPMVKRAFGLVALLLAGCSAMLPHGEEIRVSRWSSFEEAKQAFDAVEPYVSDTTHLRGLGFDPDANPNVRILNYLEVLDRVLPDKVLTRDDLAPGLQDCVAAGEACRAFEVNQRETHNKRYGNFVADFLNFRRKTEIRGWEFNAVIVLRDKLVVYKIWSGKPNILEKETKTNPLGPLQGIGPDVVRP